MKKIFLKQSIESIIEQRLTIQSTKKELEKYGIFQPSLRLFKSDAFLSHFNKLNEQQKNSFIKILGGPANFKKTKEYIEGKG